MPITIPGDAWGGVFLRGWFGPVLAPALDPVDAFALAHTGDTDGYEPCVLLGPDHEADGRYLLSRADGWDVMSTTTWCRSEEAATLRLDPTRPEVAHRIADVLRAGERCPTCGGTGKVSDGEALTDLSLRSGVATARAFPALANFGRRDCDAPGCVRGYLRPPHDVTALLPPALGGRCVEAVEEVADGFGAPDGSVRKVPASEVSAALLACSVARVEAGLGVVRGVLGEWLTCHDGDSVRSCLVSLGRYVGAHVGRDITDGANWRIFERTGSLLDNRLATGPETGPAGRAAADAAALALGWALLSADAPHGLRLPSVTR